MIPLVDSSVDRFALLVGPLNTNLNAQIAFPVRTNEAGTRWLDCSHRDEDVRSANNSSSVRGESYN